MRIVEKIVSHNKPFLRCVIFPTQALLSPLNIFDAHLFRFYLIPVACDSNPLVSRHDIYLFESINLIYGRITQPKVAPHQLGWPKEKQKI